MRYETSRKLASYLHGTRIGVIVEYDAADEQVGRDVAMHVAASKPLTVSKDEVPADKIEAERKVFAAQAAESGKSPEIVAKMVEGRVSKYLAEVALLGQPFVKNPDETVEKMLKAKGATVSALHAVRRRRRHREAQRRLRGRSRGAGRRRAEVADAVAGARRRLGRAKNRR